MRLANILRGWSTICVFLLFSQGISYAQLSAQFTANTTSGCAPIVVQFTDQSTGNPTQWKWDLGNGVISYLQNPSATYFNPGSYSIKLVVRTSTGADSIVKNQFITVRPNPVINFRASDSSGCFPLPVQFTDLSTTASGSNVSWEWDFGDGHLSKEKNPLHVYTGAGNFSVTLRVTNSFGCTRTFSKTQLIKVSEGVKADFSNNTPAQCQAPVTVSFTNTSAGPGSLTYVWDFGDGNKSTAVNPIHTYTNPGSYSVSLIAVSSQGCIDTVKKINLISVGTIKTDFSIPASLCAGQQLTFQNMTTPVPSGAVWYFSDGTTYTGINAIKTFEAGGNYTIKLVNNFSGCSDSITKSIAVLDKPAAKFSADQTNSCKPFTVKFLNQTAGAVSYKWNFGDGTTSADENPIHSYTNSGKYTVILISFNVNGCSDTLVKTDFISIQKPAITLHDLPKNGCNPLTINPSATIVSADEVVSYLWNFGDGSTSKEAKPTYTYTKAGTYDVTLTITTASGCSETTTMNEAIRVGNKPQLEFAADKYETCASTAIQFTNSSTGDIDKWYWNFSDGGISDEQNPKFSFHDTGWVTITLIAWSNTCSDTLTKNNFIYIKPPVSNFSVTGKCNNKYEKKFINSSIGATGWVWNFGDGTTSTEKDPIHVYQKPGVYKVSLFVTNGSCSNNAVINVQVIDEKAMFLANERAVCKNSIVLYNASTINSSLISSWLWNFGDGNTSNEPANISHTYSNAGKYIVSLTITDIYGCVDTKSMEITVHGPTASFISDKEGSCLENNITNFSSTSTSDGTNALKSWNWNFGDDNIGNGTSVSHSYDKAGEYTVSLTVTDEFGCSDKSAKSNAVIIAKPIAEFYSVDTLSCTNKPIRFSNTSTGYSLQYTWSFGDKQNSGELDPVHQYNNIGMYDIKLVVQDRFGCIDSTYKSKYINISFPKAAFTVSDSSSSCPPLLVNFTNASTDYTSVRWDFGDGNTSTLLNPSHYYTVPGIFYAKLTATGPGGCTDVRTQKIEVRGPKGSFNYEPVTGCNPLTVKFTATTTPGITFTWDFSDGTTLATNESIVTHTYTAAGDFIPKLILKDETGCTVPIMGIDTISVVGIEAKFKMSKNEFCEQGEIKFTDLTVANDLITNWEWAFGDGTSSSEQHPVKIYNKPGTYNVQLKVTTETGCYQVVSGDAPVKIFENPVIQLIGDSVACAPARLAYRAEVVKGNEDLLKWNWSFSTGQTSTNKQPEVIEFNTAGKYKVTVKATNEYGCFNVVEKNISINAIPSTNAGADLIACLDKGVQLKATGAKEYIWNASPSLSCTDCSTPTAKPTSTETFVVRGINEFGCSKMDTVQVIVRQPFKITASKSDSICLGTTVKLSASGAEKYSWYPSTGLDNITSATPKAKPNTSTFYSVIGKDNDNCFSDTAYVYVHVTPLPIVDAGEDLTIAVGSSGQLKATASADVTSLQWTPSTYLSCNNCLEPHVSAKQTTTYKLEAKNAGGCKTTDEVTVTVICNNGNVYIPNTFTPNGDGMNDIFFPRGKGIYMVKSMRVFNRWGEVVFERLNFQANDASAGWDGMYKGQKLATDVYIYTCEIVCENNETIQYKGDLTLLK
jgi:gliding motility-associated-like protein